MTTYKSLSLMFQRPEDAVCERPEGRMLRGDLSDAKDEIESLLTPLSNQPPID